MARLALEIAQLRLQGADHVLKALQICLRRPELELGLVPARVQAGDAGRLFEQGPPLCRLCADDVADPPLAHQCRAVCAGRGVREQNMHVPGADLVAVDGVGRTLATLDAAGYLDLGGILEARRRGPVRIVEAERGFGDGVGRTAGGAAEDHVLHAAATHLARRGLAHHPAQRFDEVRLAAAVRADDPRQPALDMQLRRLDEGLEARDSELRYVHGFPLRLGARDKTVDMPGERLEAHLALVFLAIDDHRRRAAYVVFGLGRSAIDWNIAFSRPLSARQASKRSRLTPPSSPICASFSV